MDLSEPITSGGACITPERTGAARITPENVRRLQEVIQRKQLRAVFQPILDFRARSYLAYEGLIRGPQGSDLESPAVLFELAHVSGQTVALERLCREIIFRAFAAQGLPGKLFVNVSVGCLADPFFLNGDTAKLLAEVGLNPRQIVIEITENQHVSDFSALRDLLATYRKTGYQIAVDDLGEGFSNLRMWSEVRPEFVKIDRHFINGIADDALKFQLVKAMQELSEASHARIIAEGIETEAEFTTVRDLGIEFGQGFLISRPQEQPERIPQTVTTKLLNNTALIVFPQAASISVETTTVRDVLAVIEPMSPQHTNDEIFARFETEEDLQVLPVIDSTGLPVGIINRHSLIDRFARPFRREIYGRKPCTTLMDPEPLVLDQTTTVQEAGQILSAAAHHHMLDGFIITEQGRYIGMGGTQALMSLITDMQIRAARYANPLTQLPGNVPINEHIDRLLDSRRIFVACYCDLDHFKPYNDTYGYRRGDQVIQFLGDVLRKACDRRLDFVGHVGGDDFVLIMQNNDWQEAVTHAIERFDQGIRGFAAEEHVGQGGYWGEDRRGQPVFHALPTLSIGVVVVEPGLFQSHHEVSAAISSAKKQAKKRVNGSGLFIERRKSGATHPLFMPEVVH
ncbi:MAG: GGDEF domain-containing protein [Rhodocyclaceae bacterium]|nr:MAG: GGDEF domain-containing protein [Rhodocyclaceae bacterium]